MKNGVTRYRAAHTARPAILVNERLATFTTTDTATLATIQPDDYLTVSQYFPLPSKRF